MTWRLQPAALLWVGIFAGLSSADVLLVIEVYPSAAAEPAGATTQPAALHAAAPALVVPPDAQPMSTTELLVIPGHAFLVKTSAEDRQTSARGKLVEEQPGRYRVELHYTASSALPDVGPGAVSTRALKGSVELNVNEPTALGTFHAQPGTVVVVTVKPEPAAAAE